MATTRIISLHGHKGQTVAQTLHDRIDYAENPDKTQGGRLVSSYECQSETAADEFAASKYLYEALTRKERPPSQDVLAYMIRQSFKPGEVTPEQANEIGYALAMEFTKGEHQFIVATHTEKSHIHNHVIFNSTTLDCVRKFANPHQCGKNVAKISNRLCREQGLSVVENPKQKDKSYKEWNERRKGQSWKGKLQETIDRVLPDSRDFDDFLARMRSKTLGPEYTPEALRERLNGSRGRSAARKTVPQSHSGKVNLLIDIQAKLQTGKGVDYEKWAKVFNLKEAAKKAFDKLGGAKIPTVAQIQAEFSGLLAEKKGLYETYKAARKEMIEYQTAKQNIGRLLSIQPHQEPRRGQRSTGSESRAVRRVLRVWVSQQAGYPKRISLAPVCRCPTRFILHSFH